MHTYYYFSCFVLRVKDGLEWFVLAIQARKACILLFANAHDLHFCQSKRCATVIAVIGYLDESHVVFVKLDGPHVVNNTEFCGIVLHILQDIAKGIQTE